MPENNDGIVDGWVNKAVMTVAAAVSVSAAAQFSSPAAIEIHQDALVGPVTMVGWDMAML